jgi:hypothetical protein
MDSRKITIQKIEDHAPPPVATVGAKRKTVKTFPRGVLKKFQLKSVKDPAKSPPLKKGMQKHTLRILTEKGLKKHRKTQKRRLASLPDAKVKEIVAAKGLVKNPKTPAHISRQILDNAMAAGFVSV